MSNVNTVNPVMTPAELCAELGGRPSLNTVLRLLSEGQIPAIRLGRRWFIPRAAYEKWLAEAGREPVTIA